MIPIKKPKDPDNIPKSLRLPDPQKPYPKAATTHKRRLELIERAKKGEGYLDEANYNNRYKQNDTKTALEVCYYFKCAYCEGKVRTTVVEHYRPKSLYPWLAYSWDNLLLICGECNSAKGSRFDLAHGCQRVAYTEADLNDIHQLADRYQQLEQPLLLHPELDDLTGRFSFESSGIMNGQDDRAKHTIKRCNLNRYQDERLKILQDFQNRINSMRLSYEREVQAKVARGEVSQDTIQAAQLEAVAPAIEGLIGDFISAAFNPSEPYSAFRQFAAQNFLETLI